MGWGRASALALTALISGACGTPALVDQCRGRVEARDWKAVVAACAQAAREHPEARTGLDVVNAHVALGDWQAVIAAAGPLFAGPDGGLARVRAAYAYLHLGDEARGEALLREALARGLAQRRDEDVAAAAQQLGHLFLARGHHDEAFQVIDRGLVAARRSGSPQAEARLERASAELFDALGLARLARDAFVRTSQLQAGAPRERMWTLFKYGVFLLDLDETRLSIRVLEEALALAEAEGDRGLRDAVLMNLAESHRLLGDLDRSAAALAGVDPTWATSTAYLRLEGLFAAAKGDPVLADQKLAAAEATGDDYLANIIEHRGRLAEARGDDAQAEAHYRRAVAAVEDLRARNETIELRSWVLARRRWPFERLYTFLAERGRGLEALEVAERLNGSGTFDLVVGERGPTAEVHATLAGLRGAIPALTAAALAPPMDQAALLAAVGQRDVLHFFRARGQLWRIQLAGGQVQAVVPLPAELDDALAAWRAAPDRDDLAGRAADLLLPAQAARRTDEPLYLVVDQELTGLPWPALRVGERYLVETRPVVHLPGLALPGCRDTGAGSGPVFVGDAAGDLPAARTEAQELAYTSGGASYVGEEALRGRVLHPGDAAYLHVAVHGSAAAGGGRLRLADGDLLPAEILARAEPPALVVLASCATGSGDESEGWGALSSAFLAAGAQTVVATVRSIGDEAAAGLFWRFYELGGAERPALALALAQRELAGSRPVDEWAYAGVFGSAAPGSCRH